MDDLAQFAALDQPAQLQHGRVEPDVVVHGEDLPARRARFDDLRRLARVHGQRLFADDVFAGPQRGQRHLAVEPVGRGDVDHVHVGAGQQLAVIGKRLRDAQPGGGFGGQVGHVANGGHGDAQPAQGLDVNRTDEAGADDSGAEGGDAVRCFQHG